MRIKRGTTRAKERRKLQKRVKGYRWGRNSKIRQIRTAVLKAGTHAYRDRRLKKRNARRLWQVQINAAVRMNGLSYSRFINLLKKADIALDRKVLAEIANTDPAVLKAVIDTAKKVG
ncbi:MAG: 50S ribosomal protein L20 [bacterium]